MAAARGITRTFGNIALQALMFVPNLFLHRGAASAAASVTGDPKEALMGDDLALLPTPAGAVCARCAQGFRPADDVRATGKGPVHESCPA